MDIVVATRCPVEKSVKHAILAGAYVPMDSVRMIKLRVLNKNWFISFKSNYNMIHLIINGESQSFDAPLNVSQLVASLSLHGKRIAIERNGEIVPRSQFEEQNLVDGDQLEVVVAVGGG